MKYLTRLTLGALLLTATACARPSTPSGPTALASTAAATEAPTTAPTIAATEAPTPGATTMMTGTMAMTATLAAPAVTAAMTGTAPAATAAVTATEVQVTLSETKIESSLTTFSTGVPYHFVVTNEGTVEHELMIIPPVKPGQVSATQMDKMALAHIEEADLPAKAKQTLDFTFTKPAPAGTLEFACHLPGHYEAGMKLPITVK